MSASIDIDEICAQDRENGPPDRTLPWEESRDGMTVVVEPKPHWAEDMPVFRLDAREYRHYAEWTAHGARARFFGHIDTSGDDLIMKARAMIAREIADGLWS